jgi:hypothetical protein
MTYLFPPEICNHWTCFPKVSQALNLESIFRATMMGELGLSGSILEWDQQTLAQAQKAIGQYKAFRPLLRQSEVYHLTPQVNVEHPRTFQAAQYFVPGSGESLLFAFRANDPADHFTVRLHRIDLSKRYSILNQDERREVTGEDLRHGLELNLPETGSSALIRMTSLK